MISLFDSIYSEKRLASSNQLQIMLKLAQQDLTNGLVEILYSPEDKILLLLEAGKITCAYHCQGDTIVRYPLSDLAVLWNSHSEGQIRVCGLTPSFLRAVKTVIEQPRSSNILSSSTSELAGVIQRYQSVPEPELFHIRWPHAEGFVFLPGNGFSPRQYAFLSDGRPSDSAAAVSMFSRWSEPECTISQYTCDSEREVWKENTLQLGFALLVEQIMHRHEELVGHLLSRKLEDSLNRLCQTQAWNISVASSTVDDVQLFDSLPDAVTAYRAILDLARSQVGVVIGARLFNEALESGLENLGQPLRQALERNELVASQPTS